MINSFKKQTSKVINIKADLFINDESVIKTDISNNDDAIYLIQQSNNTQFQNTNKSDL